MGNTTTGSDTGGDGPSRLAPGTMIAGRYRLEEPIGRGGMATVYRAFQPSLNRHVAIKVMRGGSPRDVARFTQEAETLARLRHPNAVVAHDFGLHEDLAGHGHPFIVMELVRGETLQARLERTGPLPPELVRHIAREVASCVGAAHRIGVVHRDLKPTNIMLVATDGAARPDVRVLDFGIAKLFSPDRAPVSDEGEIVGSPRYMAPEQFDDGPIDVRVDVWTFGLLVLEMLTGSHPLGRSGTFAQVLAWHRGGPPGLPEDTPRDLSRTVSRCLRPDPRERPGSMERASELLHDGGRGKGRRRVWWALAVTLGLLVLVGLVLWLRPSRSSAPSVRLRPALETEGERDPTVILVPRLDPFWRSTLPFVEAAAEALERPVRVYDAGGDADRMVEQLAVTLRAGPVDGVVAQSFEGNGPEILDQATGRSVRVVAINNQFERAGRVFATIRSDDERTGRELAEHLLALPPSAPVVLAIHGPLSEGAFADRRRGLDAALRTAGLEAQHLEVSPNRASARHATRQALLANEAITHVWAGNDDLALGAVEGAVRAGRQPGTDMVIGGVDWIPEALDAIAEGQLSVSFGGHMLEPGLALVVLEAGEEGPVPMELPTRMRPATAANVDRIRRAFQVGTFQRLDFDALVRAVQEGRAETALDPAVILRLDLDPVAPPGAAAPAELSE